MEGTREGRTRRATADGAPSRPDELDEGSSDVVVSAPVLPVAGAAVVVAIAALALVPATTTAHAVGYASGMIGSILLAAVYQVVDRRRSQSALYSRRDGLNLLSRGLLGVGLLLGVLHIAYLSIEAAR